MNFYTYLTGPIKLNNFDSIFDLDCTLSIIHQVQT